MVIAYICLFVGTSAIGVSTYYSFLWFIQRGMPFPIALILALIYVIFSNLVFEFAFANFLTSSKWNAKLLTANKEDYTYKVVRSRRNSSILKGVGCFIGWSFLAFYSMYCTVGGQYDQLMNIEGITENKPVAIIDHSKSIERKEKEVEALESEEKDLIKVKSFAKSLKDRYDWINTFTRTENRLVEVQERKILLGQELDAMYKKQAEDKYDKSFNVSKRGFFVYIYEIVKVLSPAKIQFWSALFPSIVIDIISPICITIFVITWRRKKKAILA